jgi:hypothetical protein
MLLEIPAARAVGDEAGGEIGGAYTVKRGLAVENSMHGHVREDGSEDDGGCGGRHTMSEASRKSTRPRASMMCVMCAAADHQAMRKRSTR